MASQYFSTELPDLTFSWDRMLVHWHNLPKLQCHDMGISAMNPLGELQPQSYPIQLQLLVHSSYSAVSIEGSWGGAGSHSTEMNLTENSSLREGRDAPICNSSPFSGLAHGKAPQIAMSAGVRDQCVEVWGWCFHNHDRAVPPSHGTVARVHTLLYDHLCAPVSSKRRKEIANGHLASMCKFVRKRQRLIRELLCTVNYLFLTDYK